MVLLKHIFTGLYILETVTRIFYIFVFLFLLENKKYADL